MVQRDLRDQRKLEPLGKQQGKEYLGYEADRLQIGDRIWH